MVVYGLYPWQISLVIIAVGVGMQLFTHSKFEGRTQAIHDDLQKTTRVAPLFVILEIMFFFGYRRELNLKMRKRAEENIREYHKNKSK